MLVCGRFPLFLRHVKLFFPHYFGLCFMDYYGVPVGIQYSFMNLRYSPGGQVSFPQVGDLVFFTPINYPKFLGVKEREKRRKLDCKMNKIQHFVARRLAPSRI